MLETPEHKKEKLKKLMPAPEEASNAKSSDPNASSKSTQKSSPCLTPHDGPGYIFRLFL